MNGIGNDFHPSMIEDTIYDILDPHTVAFNLYDRTAGPAVMEYLEDEGVEFNLIEDPYPDMTGASVSVCWIELRHLHHIVFDVLY